ncbi:MAG: Fe-S cluster assembly protein SufB, partial [Gemmatimonadetes bacterium]|nr:Fe-S cluster assembly protein SufB [Gemmatimonadota bacterium]
MPYDETVAELGLDEYKYDFVTDDKPIFKSKKGLSEEVVRQISAHKEEPEWMLEFRLKALEIYESKPMPTWGGDLTQLNLDEIYFYVRPQDQMERSWDDVPQEIKDTFEKLGIPEAERKVL